MPWYGRVPVRDLRCGLDERRHERHHQRGQSGRLHLQDYGTGRGDVFVASFTSGGVLQWTRLFGSALDDLGFSIAVDGSAMFISGQTSGSMYGQPSLGGSDLFVLQP